MLYSKYTHSIPMMQPAHVQEFELYSDELRMLADFAEKTDKKEMTAILKRLAEYGQAKAQRNRGPVHFNYK